MKTRIYCGIEGIYGDIISYTPVVKWLKERIPNSYLIFGISKRCEKIKELLERDPLIDEVYVHKYASTGKYDPEELAMRASCDFVFENKVDHKSIDWPARRDATQEWAWLQGLNVPKGLRPRLYPKPFKQENKRWGIDTPCPVRCWQPRYWDYLYEELNIPRLDYTDNTGRYMYSFEDMVSLIKHAKYIVTTNAIGMWVASCFETPGVLLLGNEYEPLVPPPPNPNMIVIEKLDVKDITPQEVKEAIRRLK